MQRASSAQHACSPNGPRKFDVNSLLYDVMEKGASCVALMVATANSTITLEW